MRGLAAPATRLQKPAPQNAPPEAALYFNACRHPIPRAGFKDPFDLVQTLKKAGLGSLELFCMGLKVGPRGAGFQPGARLPRYLTHIQAMASKSRLRGSPGWQHLSLA
jgi:hypothetical protein